jgi:hypothetical protein
VTPANLEVSQGQCTLHAAVVERSGLIACTAVLSGGAADTHACVCVLQCVAAA